MDKGNRRVKITIETEDKTITMNGMCLIGVLLDEEEEDETSVKGMMLGYDVSPIAIGTAIAKMAEVLDDLPESATIAYVLEQIRVARHISGKINKDTETIDGMEDLHASFKDWLSEKSEGGAK